MVRNKSLVSSTGAILRCEGLIGYSEAGAIERGGFV